ncbi:Uncharacterised protein [Proteus mirabilis]|uniref:Uncharacterized protein n=1 Tax=Proteus mirabilis TaxID=584 RepID=A0A2X2BG61_PROMI|nr:Uncharacterised protein [Proteus mirabilis]
MVIIPHDKVEAMYQSSTNAIVATDQETDYSGCFQLSGQFFFSSTYCSRN